MSGTQGVTRLKLSAGSPIGGGYRRLFRTRPVIPIFAFALHFQNFEPAGRLRPRRPATPWRGMTRRASSRILRGLRLVLPVWLLWTVSVARAAFTPGPFYVNYSLRVPTEPLTVHPWVILDPGVQRPDLAAARAAGTRVLAYLSVGEMAAGASYRAAALAAGLPLRGTNPIWNSDLLDLRDGRWAAFLVDGPARAAIAAGFNGFFLDTLDSVETNATGAVLTAQRAALVALVGQLRAAFPTVPIVVNRGFGVLDTIRPAINGLLVESVWSTYEPATARYRAVPAADTALLLTRLNAAAAAGLEVFVLDYADPADPAAALAAARRILAAGFHAFVSTPALNGVNLGPWQPVSPAFTQAPAGLVVRPGDRAELRAEIVGSPAPSLVWRRDGAVLAGATEAALRFESVSAAQAGVYTLTATNAYGTATSPPVRLTVAAMATPPRLANLSARAQVGSGDAQLIPSFIAEGAVQLLVRGVGPGLRTFGVAAPLADPLLRVIAGDGTVLATASSMPAALVPVAAGVGAFALPAGAADAVTLVTVRGAVTAPIRSVAGGSGVALGEAFVVSAPDAGGRLLNLATRAQVTAGEGALVVGFVVAGETAGTLLVRAAGPALAGFGVTGVLADPRLELRAGTAALLAANDDWSSTPAGQAEVEAAARQLGAFAWARGSRDAALVATLPPGSYTVTVRGADGTAGVALAEVYLMP